MHDSFSDGTTKLLQKVFLVVPQEIPSEEKKVDQFYNSDESTVTI